MLTLVRALTYATVFVGFLLVFVPARLLERSGIARPPDIRGAQIAGAALVVVGAAMAVWCILTFALIGRGTPAPFDPPRRLVVRGPYAHVRNPMYLGAVIAVGGASLFYQSIALLVYALLFLAIAHVFVLVYEEPILRRTFGEDYETYLARVARWWPRGRSYPESPDGRSPSGNAPPRS